ncbi:uncharacterized protein LOC122948288 [Acropora millepora]|uniref:uncharacterized protein LOC122948288 n=1 Tax=Acropora millepora TaxID=45264 RepID=UPI001CF3F119|nr:uncharacterized protein LOC122948288 [Acropora millepora]
MVDSQPERTGSVEEVCEFLTERHVEESTVERFREEKFDCVAVQYSNESTLKELGLKLGDIFALKAFIEGIIKGSPQDNKEERKRKLIEILQKKADNSKPKRTYTKLNSGKTPARPKTRRILLGLMTYDMKKKKYTRVSLVKGGGTRKVDLPVDFNREDVIQYAVKLVKVKEDDSDLLIPVFGSPVEEKIPNLSLEAGQTECQPVVSSQFYHASSMSSVDDRSRRNRRSTPSSTSTSTGGTSGEETSFNWTLIGSSSDRRQPREEQQNALEKSLKADQEKEASKRDTAQRLESLESLRSARLARVPPEPDEMSNGEKVKISIRHPSLVTSLDPK